MGGNDIEAGCSRGRGGFCFVFESGDVFGAEVEELELEAAGEGVEEGGRWVLVGVGDGWVGDEFRVGECDSRRRASGE